MFALSCDLFNISLEIVIRRARVYAFKNNMLTNSSFQLLGYADDIDIIADQNLVSYIPLRTTELSKARSDHQKPRPHDMRHSSSFQFPWWESHEGSEADLTSDNHLVRLLILCRTSCKRRNDKPQRKYNTKDLQNPAYTMRYWSDQNFISHWRTLEERVKRWWKLRPLIYLVWILHQNSVDGEIKSSIHL